LKKKIRVLELGASNYLFGAERWILALMRNLDLSSFDVTVSVIQDSNNGQTGLLESASRLGFRSEVIRINGAFDPRAISKLAKLIRSLRIDILHTHGYKTDILGYLATRLAPALLICTPHGWSTHMDFKLRAYIYLGKKVLRRADGVVPLSTGLFNDIRALGVPAARNRLVRNSVDLLEVQEARPHTRKSLGLEGEFVIGYIGELIGRKQLDTLLRAFERIQRENSNCTLMIIGNGDQESKLKGLADSLGVSPKVRFLGFREDRLSYLKLFDVFVLPSELEGIPRCLMEAMAARVNVVASAIPGTMDLIKEGITGLMFPVGNDRQLREKLLLLKLNPLLAESLREQAREHVASHYSAERMADEYSQLFRELLLHKTNGNHGIP
jgi:glycosyltransferase involved in cell wall biosynthesis